MEIGKGIPKNIQQRAMELLSAFMDGTLHARKLPASGCIALDVGLRYRLLCRSPEMRKDSSQWQLLTHQSYDRYNVGKRRH